MASSHISDLFLSAPPEMTILPGFHENGAAAPRLLVHMRRLRLNDYEHGIFQAIRHLNKVHNGHLKSIFYSEPSVNRAICITKRFHSQYNLTLGKNCAKAAEHALINVLLHIQFVYDKLSSSSSGNHSARPTK